MPNQSQKFDSTEVAILLTTANKYTPGKHKFRLQSNVGLKENANDETTRSLNSGNLLNKNRSSLPISKVTTSNVIELELPKEVTRNYPTKFIPPGTRFIVSYTSGDITKPVIVGREF